MSAVTNELLDVWEFPRTFDLAKITEIGQDRLAPPDERAHLVSSRKTFPSFPAGSFAGLRAACGIYWGRPLSGAARTV